MLTVRLATRADIAAVDDLLARAYPRLLKEAYPPSVLVLALPVMARAQPALMASGRYFLAEEAGRIIGAGGWSAAAPGGGGTQPGVAHLRHVVTDDRAVRRGVGRAVLTAVHEQARAAGMVRMECLSTLNAVPFYEALGYVVRGPVTLALRPGLSFPAVAMARLLTEG